MLRQEKASLTHDVPALSGVPVVGKGDDSGPGVEADKADKVVQGTGCDAAEVVFVVLYAYVGSMAGDL